MAGPADHAEVYRTGDGQWYWRILAANSKIIAEGESYREKHHAVDVIQAHFPYASVVDLTIAEDE
jgi:uncharacterized protein YegP (UPF0339 family)